MHKIIISTYILLNSLVLFSQDNNLWKMNEAIGDSLMKIGSYYSAADYFQKAANEMDIASLNFKLGEAYYKSRNYESSESVFKHVIDLGDKNFPMSKFFYAQSLKQQGKYDLAIEEFDYIKTHYEGPKSGKIKKWASLEIKGIQLFIKGNSGLNIQSIKVLDKTINSGNSDFAPFLLENKFYYSSSNTDSIQRFFNQSKNIRVYTSTFNNGNFSSKRIFDNIPIEENEHVANLTFSPSLTHAYYSKCKRIKNNQIQCKLYRTEIDPFTGEWGTEKALPDFINTKGNNTTQPTIGVLDDGREILYYVSDRPGGIGKSDIWYSIINTETAFEYPKNCGRAINTDNEEHSPFYSIKDQKLYFSSNGHPNYGGFDVFEAGGSGRKFEKPTNLGKGINTNADEIYFYKNEQLGFVTSNRIGAQTPSHPYCCDDIFYFRLNNKSLNFQGDVIIETNNEIDEITVSLYSIEPDQKDETLINYKIISPSEPIKFNIKNNKYYRVKGFSKVKNKLYTGSLEFNTEGLKSNKNHDLILTEYLFNKDYIFSDIIFESNKDAILPNFHRELNKLAKFLNNNKDLIVEISAHTDNIGDKNENQKLSQKRANAIVEYLLSKGVNQKHITAKGYGSTKPKVSNDTASGRETNRRCAFKIIGQEIK